jgi:tetratricopeptide (TPR) repeat protein
MAQAHGRLGNHCLEAGFFGEAAELFRKSASEQPDDPQHRDKLAEALYSMGDFVEAEKQYLAALEIDPGWWNSHLMLGRIYEERGQMDKAVAHYTAFVALSPPSPETADANERMKRIRTVDNQ